MLSPPFCDKQLTKQSIVTVAISTNSYRHLQTYSIISNSSINMTTTHFIKTCKSIDPKEEPLIDLDVAIKETKLTVGTLSQIKQTFVDNPSIISNTFCSSLSQFTIEPTFPFPEFVRSMVKNYIPSPKQILSTDGTRVIATINSKSLRKSFFLPVPNPNQNPIQFSEENNRVVIKALDSD